MHSARLLIAALFTACLLVGGLWTCANHGPRGQMIFGDSPPQEEMLGVWILAHESIAFVELYTNTSVGESSLILKPDGTFESVNLPVENYSGKLQ